MERSGFCTRITREKTKSVLAIFQGKRLGETIPVHVEAGKSIKCAVVDNASHLERAFVNLSHFPRI